MTFLKRVLTVLSKSSRQNVTSFGAQYDAFTLFILIFYLANPLKWQFSGPYTFSAIATLRIFAVIIWALLALWRHWPKSFKRYQPLFWHFCLLYHLPFRTTFSTLYSSHSPSFDSFGLLGIVALAILVDDKTFCVLTLMGIVLGSIVYFVFGGLTIELVKVSTLIYAGLMILSIAFIKLIFFRNHNLSLNERSKAYKTLAGAIAHEVRGPICTLTLACENLACRDSSSESGLRQDLAMIHRQAKKALTIVDTVLLQIKYIESSSTTKIHRLSLRDCIFAAINDARFSDSNRAWIKINCASDYLVFADRELLIQVFINLIKNALWAIRDLDRGQIDIIASSDAGGVAISIMDNGIGISLEDQKSLFDPFCGKNKNGAGVGLAFCRLAIKNMHGSIQCESKEGQFTRFLIHLRGIFLEREISNEPPASMLVSNHDSYSRR